MHKTRHPRLGFDKEDKKMKYEITYDTEIVEETWNNGKIEMDDLSDTAVARACNVDVRSRICRVRNDGRRDYYYRLWISDIRTDRFLRLREAKNE